jgi:hypothetical protein
MPTLSMLADWKVFHPYPIGAMPNFQLNASKIGMVFDLLTFVQRWIAVAH